MLVLSRKPGQELVIGDNIRVVVLDVKGDKVRLGITAPPEIPVHRREVHDRLKRALPGTKESKPGAAGNHTTT